MSGGARIERDATSPDFERAERLLDAGREFSITVSAVKGIDPLVTEATRTRCAQIHDCRMCGSVREREALEAGFDDEMHAKISQYEQSDLDPATIAALRLTDAIIIDPASADEALSEELHRHFSDEQIAEICLDVVKFSEQKHMVALRLEDPPWVVPSVIAFGDDGSHEIVGPLHGAAS